MGNRLPPTRCSRVSRRSVKRRLNICKLFFRDYDKWNIGIDTQERELQTECSIAESVRLQRLLAHPLDAPGGPRPSSAARGFWQYLQPVLTEDRSEESRVGREY